MNWYSKKNEYSTFLALLLFLSSVYLTHTVTNLSSLFSHKTTLFPVLFSCLPQMVTILICFSHCCIHISSVSLSKHQFYTLLITTGNLDTICKNLYWYVLQTLACESSVPGAVRALSEITKKAQSVWIERGESWSWTNLAILSNEVLEGTDHKFAQDYD